MNSGQLSYAQLDKLIAEVRRHEAYLSKFRSRMMATGFPVDDTLFGAVKEAHDAILTLDLKLKLCQAGMNQRSPPPKRKRR